MRPIETVILIVFLISDGQPISENYAGEAAFEDTAIAMREAVKARIKLIYFNQTDFEDRFLVDSLF